MLILAICICRLRCEMCNCSQRLLLNLMMLNYLSTFHHRTMLMVSICRKDANQLPGSMCCCVHWASDPRPQFMMQHLLSVLTKLQLPTAWKISFELVCLCDLVVFYSVYPLSVVLVLVIHCLDMTM